MKRNLNVEKAILEADKQKHGLSARDSGVPRDRRSTAGCRRAAMKIAPLCPAPIPM